MSDQFEQAIALAMSLSQAEKARLIKQLAAALEQEVPPESPKPRRSLYGILAHLGPAPSAEDIDEVRREVWKNFPREDI